jgi:hypothetical protein
MFSTLRLIVVFGALVALFATGCAAAKAAAKAEPGQAGRTSQASIDPLGASGTNLREDAEDSGPMRYDPSDTKIPGAEYGLKTDAELAQEVVKTGKKGKGKGKGKAKGSPANRPIPFSESISEQMEGLPWGMTHGSVMAFFDKQVRAAYAEELKNSGGLVEEDRIRGNMLRDLAKLKNSYLEFKGQRTGFEGSLIENEFTHNNNESMFMWDAGKYVEYMFFFEGRFWKRLRAFRKDQINNLDFDAYVGTLENRFGAGKEIMSPDGQFVTYKWKNKDTYMTAEDRSSFYGVYCLVFSARATEDNLAKLRVNEGRLEGRPKENVSSMVEAITKGDDEDGDSSVIDSYTGGGPLAAPPDKGASGAPPQKGPSKKQESKPAQNDKKADTAPNLDDLF